MKNFLLILICSLFTLQYLSHAQNKYFTRTGKIVFYSKAPIEDIKAVNNQVSCIYESESNRLVANVLITAFEFEKALMQKHFNENYMESDKFPKASFKGKIIGSQEIKYTGNWIKKVDYEGDITIHGVTKPLKSTANIQFTDGSMNITTEFYLLLKDFDIKVPSTVINNISEKIQVKISLKLNELKN